jgi:hypothetical protein
MFIMIFIFIFVIINCQLSIIRQTTLIVIIFIELLNYLFYDLFMIYLLIFVGNIFKQSKKV